MFYIESNSTSVYFNFGLEYYVINELKPEEPVFLFWRTDPTVMIGKYQNTAEEINLKYVEENGINIVRRMSGGGTIYTDLGCWQFTFITKGRAEEIDFKKYITPVVGAVKDLGIQSAQATGRNDLTIAGRKFSGNAQYVFGGYTVHHGTLLFDTDIDQMVRSTTVDAYKITSKGIKSVRDRVTNISDHLPNKIDPQDFKQHIINHIMAGAGAGAGAATGAGAAASAVVATAAAGESLAVARTSADRAAYPEYHLSETEISRIQTLADQRFNNWDAKFARDLEADIHKISRLAGGKLEVKLQLKSGKIVDSGFYGDFFGTIEMDEISAAIRGIKYDRASVTAALADINLEKSLFKITRQEFIDSLF